MEKEELFNKICAASTLGTLGYFVGTGFSKAILASKAFSWIELLEKCCEELGVGNDICNSHLSCPEIATMICENYAANNGVTYNEALKKFKHVVSRLTNVNLNYEDCEAHRKWFNRILPSWVVTTNYDRIIESIIGARALSISPSQCFLKVFPYIPVFHLHGICNEEDGIVITNEDYISMFRPGEYRQARLPILIKESCVLMIGYGLGDINVITAMDWAKNVYKNLVSKYEFQVIQLVYTEQPRNDKPYVNSSGVVIYEIKDLKDFFSELGSFMEKFTAWYIKGQEEMNKKIAYFANANQAVIEKYADDDNFRRGIVNYFKGLKYPFGYVYDFYLPFLKRVVNFQYSKSVSYGAFETYNKILKVLLDALIEIPADKIPDIVFRELAAELNSVGFYIDLDGKYTSGKAFSATETWHLRKKDIPQETIDKLNSLLSTDGEPYLTLRELLKTI